MKVAIVGAGGGMGLALIHACHAADMPVIAVVRNESKIPEDVRKKVDTVVEGNAKEKVTVTTTLSHSPDVVIIAVGSKNTKDPQTVRNDVTKAYADPLSEEGAKMVIVSSLGAGDSGMQTNWFLRTFILGKVLKHPLDDHNSQEAYVLDTIPAERYLIVRPTALNDKPAKNDYEIQETEKLRSAKISRADVANFIVKQIKGEGEMYWGKKVSITW